MNEDVYDLYTRIDELVAEIADINARNYELEKRVKKLEEELDKKANIRTPRR